MFARVKKSGKYEYLQIVKNRKDNGKARQRVMPLSVSWIGFMTKTGSRL